MCIHLDYSNWTQAASSFETASPIFYWKDVNEDFNSVELNSQHGFRLKISQPKHLSKWNVNEYVSLSLEYIKPIRKYQKLNVWWRFYVFNPPKGGHRTLAGSSLKWHWRNRKLFKVTDKHGIWKDYFKCFSWNNECLPSNLTLEDHEIWKWADYNLQLGLTQNVMYVGCEFYMVEDWEMSNYGEDFLKALTTWRKTPI